MNNHSFVAVRHRTMVWFVLTSYSTYKCNELV